MFLENWLSDLQSRLLSEDLLGFLPELVLCAAIVAMLFLRLFRAFDKTHLSSVACVFAALAILGAVTQWPVTHMGTVTAREVSAISSKDARDLFGGMLAFDNLTVLLRIFLTGFLGLMVWLSILTGIPDREDSADFYCLLFGATLGMCIMASAKHLLMVFIGIEMASLPSYALVGFLKGRRQSSEAALKYVVYGGGASGIMLYGISLLVGKFGTGYLPDLAKGFEAVLQAPASAGGPDAILMLGSLFVLIGIAFKLSVVPFHFWCPDVFEGASAEVAAFLSVASKGAAFALLGRFVLVLGGMEKAVASTPSFVAGTPEFATWLAAARYLAPPLGILAAITATFGNLAAYRQTNLKRLLAYSTIAHAGYMLMGLAACTAEGCSAVLFYLFAYLIMNLGAFAVVAFLRNKTGSEDLSSFRGLIQKCPVMVVALGFFMFSLLGVPPLVGFAAKFQIFQALFDAGRAFAQPAPRLSSLMYALLVIGGINTVFSVFYYMNVMRVMILENPPGLAEGEVPEPLAMPTGSIIYASLLAATVLGVGILWNPLAEHSAMATERFLRLPGYGQTPVPRGEAPPPRGMAGPPPGAGAGGAAKGGIPKANVNKNKVKGGKQE